MQTKTKNYIVLLILISVLIAPSFAFAAWWNPFSWSFWNSIFHKQTLTTQNPVACPMIAKLCPDGSSVSPQGPKCEFPACPIAAGQTASQQISDNEIINAINTLEGIQLKKDSQTGKYVAGPTSKTGWQSYSIDLIAKGDLNGDGFQDAILSSTGCGAACGSIFTVVINKSGNSVNAFVVNPGGFITAGDLQSLIRNITIDNGVVTISVATIQNNGNYINHDFTYKLIGNNLVKTN